MFPVLSFFIAVIGLWLAYRTYTATQNQGQTPVANRVAKPQFIILWTSHPDPQVFTSSDIQDYLLANGYSYEDATTAAATATQAQDGSIVTQVGIIPAGALIRYKQNTTSLTGGPRPIMSNSVLDWIAGSQSSGATTGSNSTTDDRNVGGSLITPTDYQLQTITTPAVPAKNAVGAPDAQPALQQM